MARRRPLDVTFGAKRYDPATVSSSVPAFRSRSGRRDFSVKVPRNGPEIKAPERNYTKAGADVIASALSYLDGGDERERVQRASSIANAFDYINPYAPIERALRNAGTQLSGGPEVTTADYLNLVLPAAGMAVGKVAPALLRSPVGRRVTNWLGETKPPLVDPDYIESPFRVVRTGPAAEYAAQAATEAPPSLFSARAPQPRVTGPTPPMGLPAPGPGLPEWAVKPRGGQWWINRDIDLNGYTENNSPENAVKALAARYFDTPEDEIVRGLYPEQDVLRDWLQKSLPRYIKNDLGTPDDPLRGLAAQGFIPVEGVNTPQAWTDLASQAIMQDPIEQIMFPRNPKGGMRGAGSDLRGGALSAMPWLAKVPVNESLYGITPYGINRLGFGDVVLGMQKAMMPEIYDIPQDFVVKPESLSRMSFPQAVERVGQIEQALQAKQNEAAQAALKGPAISTFKEYPDDPRGMRWVEFKYPEPDVSKMRMEHDPQNDLWSVIDQEGNVVSRGASKREAASLFNKDEREQLLKDALECESDQLGICVGKWRQYPQYYQGVISGDKRIFSLRDAKGQSHATIETNPDVPAADESSWIRENSPLPDELHRAYRDWAGLSLDELRDIPSENRGFGSYLAAYMPDIAEKYPNAVAPRQQIIQIKGTRNERPLDKYQQYITDFIKSGKFSNIGDIGHTDIVQLPDGRIITKDQYAEGMKAAKQALGSENISDIGLHQLVDWDRLAPHFQGYAIGGRVSAERCFCHNPLSVR